MSVVTTARPRLSVLKHRVKQILFPPKYRILENPRAQIEAIVRRHMAEGGWHSIKLLLHGVDSIVADVNDTWIFKFPRGEYAAQQVEKEAQALAYFGERLGLAIPRMTLHDEECFYSCHAKIPGDFLTSQIYESLTEAKRDNLARTLASFFVQLHATPLESAKSALRLSRRGPWKPSAEIIAIVEALLPPHIHPYIRQTMARIDAMSFNEAYDVVGHFDVHGENLAFDVESGCLRGVFDFADIAFGDYHREFQAPGRISPDLTGRIIPYYEKLSGRAVDRNRVALYREVEKIVNVGLSKDIRPQVVTDFIRDYDRQNAVKSIAAI